MLAWFGADVVKLERSGKEQAEVAGRATLGELTGR
jgi:hypothetical protein